MRKFKKFVSTAIIAAMAGTLCLTGCGSNSSSESSTGSSKSEKQVTVAVVQPMSHTSLDQIRDTITSELGKDDNIKVVTDNANGDTAALSSIIENYKSEGVDIVVPIATSTAQTAKSVYDGEDTQHRQQRAFMMEKIHQSYSPQFQTRKQQVLQEKIVRISRVFLTTFQQMKSLS